jgi:hypothetical protein
MHDMDDKAKKVMVRTYGKVEGYDIDAEYAIIKNTLEEERSQNSYTNFRDVLKSYASLFKGSDKVSLIMGLMQPSIDIGSSGVLQQVQSHSCVVNFPGSICLVITLLVSPRSFSTFIANALVDFFSLAGFTNGYLVQVLTCQPSLYFRLLSLTYLSRSYPCHPMCYRICYRVCRTTTLGHRRLNHGYYMLCHYRSDRYSRQDTRAQEFRDRRDNDLGCIQHIPGDIGRIIYCRSTFKPNEDSVRWYVPRYRRYRGSSPHDWYPLHDQSSCKVSLFRSGSMYPS